MIAFLNNRICSSGWISREDAQDINQCTGVLVRQDRGLYLSAPDTVNERLMAAVVKMNVEVAFTMRTDTIDAILATLDRSQTDILLTDGSQIQVLDSLSDVLTTKLKKLQYAALLRKEETLLVWHDDLQQILPHAMRLEEKLLSLVSDLNSTIFPSPLLILAQVWGSAVSPFKNPFDTPTPSSANTSFYNLNDAMASMPSKQNLNSMYLEKGDIILGDAEEESLDDEPESLDRPVSFVSSVFVGLAMCLLVVLLFGFATANLIVEFLYDGNAMRLILLVTIPFLGLVGLFL